ncbi:hypothetical protein VPH35_004348 [Triticum aestivum]
MSSSDILLRDGYHPKLSQYGLAELGQQLRRMSNCVSMSPEPLLAIAPETTFTRKLITGRRPVEPAQAIAEDRNLVIWATRLMDRSQFRWMADPALQGRYPSMDLQEALKVASMCIHKLPAMRSPIGAVVAALSRLAAYDDCPPESSHHAAPC